MNNTELDAAITEASKHDNDYLFYLLGNNVAPGFQPQSGKQAQKAGKDFFEQFQDELRKSVCRKDGPRARGWRTPHARTRPGAKVWCHSADREVDGSGQYSTRQVCSCLTRQTDSDWANFVFADSSKAGVGRTGREHHLRTCPEKSGGYRRRVSMF